jgi:Flp pilus assembly protein TadG
MHATERVVPNRHRRRLVTSRRGQSLVEFALILPILLTLVGAAIDIARVYGAWVALEGATRDAAEQVATDTTVTTCASALTKASSILSTELASTPGSSVVTTCPQLWAKSTASPGSPRNPLVTVTVSSTLAFRTLFAYPLFTQAGAWTLRSDQTYAILQGR